MKMLAAVALAAVAAPLASAQVVKDALELNRQAVETQRRVLVAGALAMTDAEARAFWPLFDAYEKERRTLDEQTNQLVADFVVGSASLSDARASAMLDQALKLDDERLRLRRTWLAKMSKALPPRKLVRFFQIENKLDSVVHADVARQIPLVP